MLPSRKRGIMGMTKEQLQRHRGVVAAVDVAVEHGATLPLNDSERSLANALLKVQAEKKELEQKLEQEVAKHKRVKYGTPEYAAQFGTDKRPTSPVTFEHNSVDHPKMDWYCTCKEFEERGQHRTPMTCHHIDGVVRALNGEEEPTVVDGHAYRSVFVNAEGVKGYVPEGEDSSCAAWDVCSDILIDPEVETYEVRRYVCYNGES